MSVPNGQRTQATASRRPLLQFVSSLIQIARWQLFAAVVIMTLTSLTEGLGVALEACDQRSRHADLVGGILNGVDRLPELAARAEEQRSGQVGDVPGQPAPAKSLSDPARQGKASFRTPVPPTSPCFTQPQC